MKSATYYLIFLFAIALGSMTIKTSFNFTSTSGMIFRLKSFWLGLHYSDYNDRYCLNVLPCVTIWWIGKNGKVPAKTL